MKCLVTGGAGFIGSHIQDKLVELGHEVAILDNLRSGKEENLNLKSQFLKVDVTDKEAVLKALSEFKPEVVFHLAAQNEVPYSMEHPFEDQNTNIVGMMNVLEGCRQSEVKKVIYSNTGGAFYGDVPEDHLPLKEDEPVLKPSSFYGVSKLSAEYYLKLYGNLFGIKWVSLRYSNVYGPRQAGNKEAGVVAIFVEKMLRKEQPTIFGDGLHTRDYVYVEDVADSNIKALDFNRSDFFNISTGMRTSNNQVFKTIEEELKTGIEPKYGPERPGDTRHSCLSPNKAIELLNWEPKTDFKTGVNQTAKYYLSHK